MAGENFVPCCGLIVGKTEQSYSPRQSPAVRPGYGLYDRALGIMYMLGVWDLLDRLDTRQ